MDNRYLEEKLETFDGNVKLKELQKYVNDMIEIRGFSEETMQDLMLLLTEEIGELAKEIRKTTNIKMDVTKRKDVDVEGEIVDVFIYILSMCRCMNIDLVEAFKEKEKKNCKRKWE